MIKAGASRIVPILVALSTFAGFEDAARAGDAQRSAAAQVLFDQGKSLVERGKFAEACPKFQESLRLEKGLGTMLWLADCFENNGQTASAWVEFKDAAATAALAKDPREKVARDRAAALEPKLSLLSITVAPKATVRGLELRRDGLVVGSAEWGIGVPVDPGVHTIAASAPGRKAWSTSVNVPKAAPLAVAVPLLEEGHDDAAPGATSSSGSAQRIAGVTLIGVGVAGAVVGTIFGLKAKSTYDKSNADGHCLPDNQCDLTGKSLRGDASGFATVSTIAFAGGAAAIAGGIILYALAPKSSKVPVSAALAPTSHGAAAFVTGSF